MIAGDTDSVTASSDDFTIAVADLKFGATAITPTAGDRITIDGTIYEVMNMAIDGAWRYADSTNSEYRIHSRRVTA